MKMLPLEKFLNRLQSKKGALDLTEKLLGFIENEGKGDFLEIGCGNGLVTRHLAKMYEADVTGIDIDPQIIELARKDVNGALNLSVKCLYVGMVMLLFAVMIG